MHARFENIRLAGFGAAAPANTERIADLIATACPEDAFALRRVAALAGLKERHVAPPDMFVSDLAIHAGKNILKNLDWDPASVDVLFFVTQTPDYLSPPTGYLIAHALGLSEKCAVMDLTSGCPGMIQGAWLACGQIKAGAQRALVLCGDTPSKVVPGSDPGNSALMGDGAGALALEFEAGARPLSFNLLSCPDADFALVNCESGYRPDAQGRSGMVMDGNKITEFCLSRAPQCIFEHLEAENTGLEDIDVFYLHQPNRMILETLRRRLKINRSKIPMIFESYANCSSASLPISVCSRPKSSEKEKALFCAFGSGLAVASMLGEWDPAKALPVIHV